MVSLFRHPITTLSCLMESLPQHPTSGAIITGSYIDRNVVSLKHRDILPFDLVSDDDEEDSRISIPRIERAAKGSLAPQSVKNTIITNLFH